MLRGQDVVVDAHDDHRVDLVPRRDGQDHLSRPGGEVLLEHGAVAVLAGRLDHDVDAERLPVDLAGLLLRQHLDLPAADVHRVPLDARTARVKAPCTVSKRSRYSRAFGSATSTIATTSMSGCDCVDDAEDVAPDPPESHDPHAYAHAPAHSFPLPAGRRPLVRLRCSVGASSPCSTWIAARPRGRYRPSLPDGIMQARLTEGNGRRRYPDSRAVAFEILRGEPDGSLALRTAGRRAETATTRGACSQEAK